MTDHTAGVSQSPRCVDCGRPTSFVVVNVDDLAETVWLCWPCIQARAVKLDRRRIEEQQGGGASMT